MQEAISSDGELMMNRSLKGLNLNKQKRYNICEQFRGVLRYVHTATERIIHRLKNLTGHFVLSGPFNTFALFTRNFDQRLGV